MKHFNLRNDEVERVQRAASFTGLAWQPICTRPKTARQFYRRVEAEMCRKQSRSDPDHLNVRVWNIRSVGITVAKWRHFGPRIISV